MRPVRTTRYQTTSAGRWVIGLLLATAGCVGPNCVQTVCPQGTAVVVTVTSPTGPPIAGLFVDVSTPRVTRISCDAMAGRCEIPGYPGRYTFSVGAPGFQSVTRTVTVSAVRTKLECDCDAITTQALPLTLVPAL